MVRACLTKRAVVSDDLPADPLGRLMYAPLYEMRDRHVKDPAKPVGGGVAVRHCLKLVCLRLIHYSRQKTRDGLYYPLVRLPASGGDPHERSCDRGS